jgi:hypothetical protein
MRSFIRQPIQRIRGTRPDDDPPTTLREKGGNAGSNGGNIMSDSLVRPHFFDDPSVPDPLPADVRWGFTRSGILLVRHYTHWIAHSKGFVGPFMERNWPGLAWKECMQHFAAAKIWVKGGTHWTGLELASHVHELHILHDGTTRVISGITES